MRKVIIITIIFIANICPYQLWAQYTFFRPDESFAIEVSLPNTALKRLPMYRNAITSLEVVGDFIVGGTSAEKELSPFIFVASLSERQLIEYKDLQEVIPGQQSIQTGFCQGGAKVLFAGTMAYKSNSEGQGGHLIQVKVDDQGKPEIEDLGVPVRGEGVFSLVANEDGSKLYGVSYPSGKFFSYNTKTKATHIYNETAPTEKDIRALNEFALAPEQYLGKALIQDDKGVIYGSMPINKLFAFDPQDESFEIFEDALPEVWGRRTLGQIESWTVSEEGMLYGGNAGDGQLFEFDPETKSVKNLGKPIMMNRLRGMTFARDGKLYGIAGAKPGYVHLFSYDASGAGFKDMGNPEFEMIAPGIEQGIMWRGFQLATIASSDDGKYIVMGEDEALSQLLIFAVDE